MSELTVLPVCIYTLIEQPPLTRLSHVSFRIRSCRIVFLDKGGALVKDRVVRGG